MNKNNLVTRLLNRGDYIAILDGKLTLKPKSGKDVCNVWLKEKRIEILEGISLLTQSRIFDYDSYSTGNYGTQKYSGITLQYTDLLTGKTVHAIFNAELKRSKNTQHGKKGSTLPKGHFTISKKSGFLKFWKKTGLKIPKRLSSFHDCMGKLQHIYITGEIDFRSKIINSSLSPVNITHKQILNTLTPDNMPTTSRQAPDNCPTKSPDKETMKNATQRRNKVFTSTCKNNYEPSHQANTNTSTGDIT